MKIVFVSVENSLAAIGFRKMAALVRQTWPQLEVLHIVPFRAASPLNRLLAKPYEYRGDPEIDATACYLAKSDMVCFSSMSTHAAYTKSLIQAIRVKNPHAYIVWGGIHPIVNPEDAILHADAVCAGEGEKAFPEFLKLFEEGRDFTRTGNFLFSAGGRVIANPLLPLLTPEELAACPYPLIGDGELISSSGNGLVPLEPKEYVRHEGLVYNMVWSIGCPNRCIYCGNSKFLDNHREYGRLRFPPVDFIIGQVLNARERYPHLSSVTFHDDMFMAIPLSVQEEFAAKWRDQVGLPFAVHGLMSKYVHPQKMENLIRAGMFRVRMGIQSGSARTLHFFKRSDSPELIEKAVNVIHRYSRNMMTPSYDLIVDNPFEAREDVESTIDMLYRLPRPFIMNLFPLMVIPGTELDTIAEAKGYRLPDIKQSRPAASFATAFILMLGLFRPPKIIYRLLRKRLARKWPSTRVHPLILKILLSSSNLKRALSHMRHGHLGVLPNRATWLIWKGGLARLMNRRIIRICSSISIEPSSMP